MNPSSRSLSPLGRVHRYVVVAITALGVAGVWFGVAVWAASGGAPAIASGPVLMAVGSALSLALIVLGGGLYVVLGQVRAFEHELARMATTDLLTGVLNRRGFMGAAAQEFTRATRYDRPLCVLAVDIDEFKAVNDRYGHAAGDAVLEAFAADWLATLRSTDTIGRTGGEEFAMILPETTPEQARELAERVCEVCARHRFEFLPPEGAVTVSVGVGSVREGDSGIEHALARADKALYQAKSTGRNRVVADPA